MRNADFYRHEVVDEACFRNKRCTEVEGELEILATEGEGGRGEEWNHSCFRIWEVNCWWMAEDNGKRLMVFF